MRILGYNGLSSFFAYLQHLDEHGTVPLYFGKGFTPEEEDREVKRALRFYDNFPGHPRTHTLKVIHDDGRYYYVHVDNLDRK